MQINAIKLPLVELKNINVKYGQHVALSNINLTVYPNSIITIVGPNGGGKSTLLKVLLKLQQPTSGQVIYNKHIRIGYVPQKIHLDHKKRHWTARHSRSNDALVDYPFNAQQYAKALRWRNATGAIGTSDVK